MCLHTCYQWTVSPFPPDRMTQPCTSPLTGAKQTPLFPWDQLAFPADKMVPLREGRGVFCTSSDTCAFLLKSLQPQPRGLRSIPKPCDPKLCSRETHTSLSVSKCLSSPPWGNALERPRWKKPICTFTATNAGGDWAGKEGATATFSLMQSHCSRCAAHPTCRESPAALLMGAAGSATGVTILI